MTRRQCWFEIACIFALFFLDGAVAPPDVNEPYYLGKAVHFWNPLWAPGDFFLQTADTHKVFFWALGWLGLWVSLPVMAWIIRILSWALLAWAWRRLSVAVLDRPWFSVLSGGLFVLLLRRYHLAGEWVIGGAEAKPLAFVLVLLAMEALLRNRWTRAWLLLGAASTAHVLAGGWTAITMGLAWLMRPGDRPALRTMLPAMALALVLALPGLLPSLALNRGVSPEIQQKANEIYVYHRLNHHLDPLALPLSFVLRYAALAAVWFLMLGLYAERRRTEVAVPIARDEEGEHLEELAWEVPSAMVGRLAAFVSAAVLIAVVGGLIGMLEYYDLDLAFALLRFYWFRMADVALPLGVSLMGCLLLADTLRRRPAAGRIALLASAGAVAVHLAIQVYHHTWNAAAAADQYQRDSIIARHEAWREACHWIAESGRIPSQAQFLTPVMSQTFKWHTGRAEVVNWKEIPQDAQSIVQWWQRVKDVCGREANAPEDYWEYSLAALGPERVAQLAREYQAEYVLTDLAPPLPFELLYRNAAYAVYRVTDWQAPSPDGADQPRVPAPGY